MKENQIEASGIPVYCSHKKIVKTDELKPNERNPHRHPDHQIELLAKIIKSQGWRNPIVVSERSGLVVKGHARLMAAKKLGLDKVPIDLQAYKDQSREWADMIADNQIAELAEMDLSLTKDLLLNLKDDGLDLDLTGYNLKALIETLPSEHVANLLPNEIKQDEMPEFKGKEVKCPKCGTNFKLKKI